jgi:ASC-1-like (ASCH) protein
MSRRSNQRTMRIYKQYFDLIKNGTKTIEVRVAYPSMKSITVGTVILFNDDPDCSCRVKRVAQYKTFDEMMAAEDPQKIHPTLSADEQLTDIKRIYPPEKEKLGVIIFEFEKV